MAVEFNDELKELLNDKEAVKVLATTDARGNPHVVFKGSIHLGDDGNLNYLELIESSKTNKNMVHNLWFNGRVALTVKNRSNTSYQIKGKPIRAVISGPVFEENYLKAREVLGDVDLAAVWVIEPEEVINQTFSVRFEHEEDRHPYFKHLDRLRR